MLIRFLFSLSDLVCALNLMHRELSLFSQIFNRVFQRLVGISDQVIKGITEEINWEICSLVNDTDGLLLNDVEYDDVALC